MGGREEGREGGRNTEREGKTIVRQCISTQLQRTVIKRACELFKEYKEEKKRGKGKTHTASSKSSRLPQAFCVLPFP